MFTEQNDVKVKVNLNLLPPASHRGSAGFIPCQSMKDFYGKGGTVTSFPPSPSVSPVTIIPPVLHTHGAVHLLLACSQNLPKSNTLSEIGELWTEKYRHLVFSLPRVTANHILYEQAGMASIKPH